MIPLNTTIKYRCAKLTEQKQTGEHTISSLVSKRFKGFLLNGESIITTKK